MGTSGTRASRHLRHLDHPRRPSRACWATGSRPRSRCASITATASRGTRRRRPTPWRFPRPPTRWRPSWRPVRGARVPVIAFGMGSSLEGHVNAVDGGVSIDLTRMTRVAAAVGRGPRRHRRGRADASQAERPPEEHRPDVPGRSRRRRDDRRHGGHARVGHDRGALRHDARERARADGGARRRPRHPHRRPRAQVVVRLRPDAAVRRLGRHARRHHRGHAAAVRPARGGARRPSARSSRWRARPTP